MSKVPFMISVAMSDEQSNLTCIIVHTRHMVEGTFYDSSVYLPKLRAYDADDSQSILLSAAQITTAQVDYVVWQTRGMRIL